MRPPKEVKELQHRGKLQAPHSQAPGPINTELLFISSQFSPAIHGLIPSGL